MTEYLVFVEEPGDAAAVAATAVEPGTSLVAMSARSSYELDRLGLPYRNPDDYYTSEEVFELGLKHTLPTLASACEYADDFLARHSPTCRRYDLRPFEANRYKLSFAFDSACLAALALERIFAEERPRRVTCFATSPEPLDENLSFREENIIVGLLPSVAREWDAALTVQPRPFAAAGRVSPWKAMLRFARGARRVLKSRDGVRWLSPARRPARPGRPPFVVFEADHGYDIVFLCEGLGRRGRDVLAWRPDTWAGAGSKREFRLCWEALGVDESFLAFFRSPDVDLFPVLERRLAHVVTWSLPRQFAVHRRANRLFDRWSPAALVAAEINSYWRVEVAKVARARDIPVVVYQHGGSYGYAQAYAHEYTALRWADLFLAYGDGVVRAFDGRRGDPESPVRAEVVPVGSARLDRLATRGASPRSVGKREPWEATVVWVCDAMLHWCRRLPPVDYENNRYYSWQKRLVALFERYPTVRFRIKPFPGFERYNPLADYVRDRGRAHLEVATDRPFWELLDEADLFLVDYVGTALLEVLTTAKPIVLFADRAGRDIAPEALRLLDGRVVCAWSVEEYLVVVESILRTRAWGERPAPDDAFLRTYGTHVADGRSQERAVEALLAYCRLPSGRGRA